MKKLACFMSAVLLASAFLNTGLVPGRSVAHAAPGDAVSLSPPFRDALIAAGVDANRDGNITQGEMAAPTALTVTGFGITDISGIEYATNLRSLTVSGTGITGLPAGFANLTLLENLDLSNNNLASFPGALLGLAGLKKLDLKMNGITALPAGIDGLANLEELNLYLNGLTSLPSSIGDLTHLKKLILHRNHISSLPVSIGNLTSLVELTVWDNWLAGLPAGIFGTMTGLAALDLSNNYFNPGGMPAGIPAFAVVSPQKTYAVSLNYNGGSGPALPKANYYRGENVTLPAASKPGYTFSGWDIDGDGAPDRLQGQAAAVAPSPVNAASVVYNAVYGYTVTFKAQPYGTIGGGTADIAVSVEPGGRVSSVPAAAANPGYAFLGWYDGSAQVSEAGILGMAVASNKTFVAKFEAAGTIHFADAAFRSALIAAGADANADGFVTETEMGQRTSLTLSGGQFTNIAGIGYAENLESLTLGPGAVAVLPGELCGLANLAYLDIGGNPIHSLPAGIGSLANLETLKMNGCGLTALPAGIAGLSALKHLNVSNNNLTGLPAWLGAMAGLESLDLSYNWFNPGAMPAGTPAFAVKSPQKTYAITLDFNRGTGSALPKSGYCRDEPIPLPNATRFDYDFIGWDTDGDGDADTAGAGTVTLMPDPPNSIAAKTYRAVYVCRSARLAGIGLSGGAALSPAFDIDTLSYRVYLPDSVAQVTLTPAAAPGGSFTMDGAAAASKTVALPLGGKATVTIACAQPGKSNVAYTVDVYRIAPVTAIQVAGGTLSPAFAVNTRAYTVSIPAATASVTITPAVSASCSGLTIGGEAVASRTLSPLPGCSATATIRAAAADGRTFEYRVTVSRAVMMTGIKLSAGALTPAFTPGVTNYTVDVAATVASVKITPVKAKTGVKCFTVNGKKASYATVKPKIGGSVSAAIVVYGTDGKAKAAYTVVVRRAALVTNIGISAGTLDRAFDPAVASYVINLPADVASVTVTPTAAPSGVRSLANTRPVLSPPVGGSASTVITAVAADKKTKSVYTVTARRAPIVSGIGVANGKLSPAFSTTRGGYTVSLPATTASLTLTPAKGADCARLLINGEKRDSITLAPAIGESMTVTIEGSTAAGTKSAYTVTVTRAALLTKVYSGSKAYPATPAFSPTTPDYTITLPATASSVAVRATKAKGVKYLYFNGKKASSYTAKPPIGGSVTVTITAVAADGRTSVTYRVTVVRRALVTNIALSGEGVPALSFDPVIPKYTVDVPADTGAVTLQAAPGSGVRSITVNGISAPSAVLRPPAGGSVTATVVATATDKRTKSTYTVTVRRAPIVTGLAISGGPMALSPAFNAATSSYTLNVPATVGSFTLTAAKGPACAALLIGGVERDSLTFAAPAAGQSMDVTVTGRTAKGTEAVYTVHVNGVALVSAISSKDASRPPAPAFDPSVAAYEINLPAATGSVVIRAAKTASAKYLTINGRSAASCTVSLPQGGSVAITVVATAADGVTKSTYTVVINRAAAS
jgi:Leucine-rich repeat (LRR) protein